MNRGMYEIGQARSVRRLYLYLPINNRNPRPLSLVPSLPPRLSFALCGENVLQYGIMNVMFSILNLQILPAYINMWPSNVLCYWLLVWVPSAWDVWKKQ